MQNTLQDKKAMLMAQLDSLTDEQLPDNIEPRLIEKALGHYELFNDLLFEEDVITGTISAVNTAISDVAGKCTGADYSDDAYFLARLSTFLTKGVLANKKHLGS